MTSSSREIHTTGIEWVIDARGCEPSCLTDAGVLKSLFDEIVADLALNTVGEDTWHVFPGTGGITGLRLLSESHLTVHTFPEHGSLCLNLFCCRKHPEWTFTERLRALAGAQEISVRKLERDYAAMRPALA